MLSGRDYFNDYRALLPKEVGNVTVIELDELTTNKYIDEVVDSNGDTCTARVVAKKISKNEYEYYTCLSCPDYNPGSEGEACEFNEDYNITAETKNYEVVVNTTGNYEIDTDGAYIVDQGANFDLPYAKAYHTQNGEKSEVNKQIVGNPKTINTNKLGTTTVIYAYKGARAEIKVKVVDRVSPDAPQVVLRYDDKNGKVYKGGWYSGDIYAEFKSTDYSKTGVTGSGIASYQLKKLEEADEAYIELKNGNKYINYYLSTENGDQTYSVKSIDKSGNESKANTYNLKIDKEIPECAIEVKSGTLGKNNWYTSNVTVGFEFTDGTVSDVFTSSLVVKNSSTGTTSKSTSITENGVYVVTGTLTDEAGNVGICSLDVKIDKVTPNKPSLAVSDGKASGTWHNANFTLSYSGASNISGNTYYYGTTTNPSTAGSSTAMTTNTDGTTYYVKVCGGNGLCSSNSSYTVKLDKTTPSAPTIVASDGKASGTWHTSNFSLSYSGASNISGNTYYYGTTTSPATVGTSTSMTTDTASTTYYVKVCSGSGLCSTNSSYQVKLDKVTPSAPTIAASDSKGSGTWHNANFTLSYSGASNISGNTYYYGTTTSPATAGASTSMSTNTTGITYYVKVCGGNGLCSSNSSYTVKLDKTTPSAPTITPSDGKASGSWHTSNFSLSYSGASNISGNTYYYGTTTSPATAGASTSMTTDTASTTYYVKVCSGSGLCSTNSSYQVKLDKVTPSLAVKSSSNYITTSTNAAVTSYLNITYGVGGGSTVCKLGTTTISNTNSLALGVNTLTCTATGNNGKVSSPISVVFRHQYTATASCSRGTLNSSKTSCDYKDYVRTDYSCPSGYTLSGTTCSKTSTQDATCYVWKWCDVVIWEKDISMTNSTGVCAECNYTCENEGSKKVTCTAYNIQHEKCGSEQKSGSSCAGKNSTTCPSGYSLSGTTCSKTETTSATGNAVYDTGSVTPTYSCPTSGKNGNTGATVSPSRSGTTCSF